MGHSFGNTAISEAKIKRAISQEIDIAKAVDAKIYVVSDGELFLWLNPKTGNYIVDENGNKITRQIKPKEETKKLADFIDLIADVASGKPTKNEMNNFREISIFKDGVIL